MATERLRAWREEARSALRSPESFWAFFDANPPPREEALALSECLVSLCQIRWDEGGERSKAAEALAGEMLRRGADPNGLEGEEDRGVGWAVALRLRRSALMAASARGELGLMRLLMGAGADPNAMSPADELALGFACGAPNALSACEALLEAGASANVGAPGGSVLPPLAIAIKLGRADLAELFVRRGADLGVSGAWGDLSSVAQRFGNEGLLRSLLERQALLGELPPAQEGDQRGRL